MILQVAARSLLLVTAGSQSRPLFPTPCQNLSCVAPGSWFLTDARIIRFVPIDSKIGRVTNTIRENGGEFSLRPNEITLARTVFRASVGNSLGKLTRWSIERFHGQTHRTLSRNGI